MLLHDWPDGIVNRVEVREVGGHISGAMKSGLLRPSSSIVSLARCAVLLEDENVSRNASYCRQKFLHQYIPVIFSVYLRCWLHKYQFSASEFWDCNSLRHHQWLAELNARAQQSPRWDILHFHGMGYAKTVVLRIWWGINSNNLLVNEPDKVHITLRACA